MEDKEFERMISALEEAIPLDQVISNIAERKVGLDRLQIYLYAELRRIGTALERLVEHVENDKPKRTLRRNKEE